MHAFAERQPPIHSPVAACRARGPSPVRGPQRDLAGNGGADWDLSQIPVHGPASRQALVGSIGGVPDRSLEPRDEDPLSVIVAGGSEASSAGAAEDEGATEAAGSARPPRLPRLSKSTVSFEKNDCGDFSWGIRWKLHGKAPAGGCIVQKVVIAIVYQPCPVGGAQAQPPQTPGTTYWEGWDVDKGKKFTARHERGAAEDDFFRRRPTPAMLASKGSISYACEARYHDGVTAAGLGFTVDRTSPAGLLPMSYTDPGLSGGSNAVPHELVASWDCCASGKAASKKTAITKD